jgi:hypothetical protein
MYDFRFHDVSDVRGGRVDRHWKLVELTLAVACVSSKDAAMRATGFLVPARLYAQLYFPCCGKACSGAL